MEFEHVRLSEYDRMLIAGMLHAKIREYRDLLEHGSSISPLRVNGVRKESVKRDIERLEHLYKRMVKTREERDVSDSKSDPA
jgi:hypothetical protein